MKKEMSLMNICGTTTDNFIKNMLKAYCLREMDIDIEIDEATLANTV
jgi:hypothetical protein